MLPTYRGGRDRLAAVTEVLKQPGFLVVLGLLVVALVALWITKQRLCQVRREAENLRTELANHRRIPAPLSTAGRAVKVVADAAARVRNQGVSGFLSNSVDDLTRWVLEDRPGIVKMAGADGTVTIFFSDIESSTETNERIGDKAWVGLLAKHDSIVRAEVEKAAGHIVKSQGDGFMIVFRDADSAVAAALGIQRIIGAGRGRRLQRNPIRVRIGMHTGTVIAKDGDYFGRNVAMAARVAAVADGGEILVSNDVRERLDSGIELTDAGVFELKGLDGENRLWRVESD